MHHFSKYTAWKRVFCVCNVCDTKSTRCIKKLFYFSILNMFNNNIKLLSGIARCFKPNEKLHKLSSVVDMYSVSGRIFRYKWNLLSIEEVRGQSAKILKNLWIYVTGQFRKV